MKKISLFLILVLLLNVLPNCVMAAGTSVAVGEYVQLGTYLGSPILWRCIEVNDNGYLMLSDKIIALKSFDATGVKINDPYGVRKDKGSDFWADSSIRTWLNSSDAEVEYETGHVPHGVNVSGGINDYALEKGFLHPSNFSPAETALIKPVSIPTAVGRVDMDAASEGSELHKYVANIGSSASNYSTAYKSYTQDLVFLPSVTDIETLASNTGTFEDEYFLAYPTENAVLESEQGYDNFSTSKRFYYWTRDPVAFALGSQVRCVYNVSSKFDKTAFLNDIFTPYGTPSINNVSAFNGGIGIRPALYIDSETSTIKSGSGTAEAPYILESTESRIFLTSSNDNALVGSEAGVSVSTINAPTDATYKYYFNGEVVESFEGITLTRPENCFIAIMYSGEAEIDRAELVLNTVSHTAVNEPYELDFDDTTSQPVGFAGVWDEEHSCYIYDEGDGYALKLYSDDDSTSTLTIDSLNGQTGTVVVKADVSFLDFNYGDLGSAIFKFRGKDKNSVYAELVPLVLGSDRYIRLNGTESDNVIAFNLEYDNPYSMELVIDVARKYITVTIDGYVVCRNVGFTDTNLSSLEELVIGTTGDGETAISIDNIKVYSIRGDRNFGYISDDKGLKLVNYRDAVGPATVYIAHNGIIVHKENVTLAEDTDVYIDTTLTGEELEAADVYVWTQSLMPYDGDRKIGW